MDKPIRTNLGAVTAYADAVKHGYTGTREEFGQLIANFGDSAKQVADDAAEVRQNKENIEGMETNVENLQSQAAQSAQEAEESKTQAAGYASAAEASRQAAETSEQNINAQVTGFDEHVAEKTASAENDIEAVRIAANKAVVAQQEESVQEVKNKTSQYITEKQSEAEQAIANKQSEAVEAVNTAGATQTDAVNTAGAAQKKAVEDAGQEALNNIGTGVDSSLSQEGKAADAAATGKAVDELKSDLANSKKVIEELNDKKITKFYASNLGKTNLSDSDKGKIQDMMLYGKSLQDGTPTPDNPVEIQSVVNPSVKVTGKNLCLAKDVYKGASSFSEITLDGRECVRFTSGTTIKNKPITFKENTQYTASFDLKMTEKNLNGEKEIAFSFFYTDGSMQNMLVYKTDFTDWKRLTFLSMASKTIESVGVFSKDYSTWCNVSNFQLEEGSTATEYEPYKVQTAILPYTLNAIPVSSGGNVTVNGQQYIADYVDIENKKIVRHIGEIDLGTLNWESKESLNSGFFTSSVFTLAKGYCLTKIYNNNPGPGDWGSWTDYLISHNDGYRGGSTGNAIKNAFIIKDTSLSGKTGAEVKQALSGIICYYELATPTEADLTDEEVQAFEDLATYYPTTNVIVTSDQLDGYTTFNYPISMENGWNLIKEQLGDTREYIYDMDLQSAEAYVNSEYAVTLTELEV